MTATVANIFRVRRVRPNAEEYIRPRHLEQVWSLIQYFSGCFIRKV